ncbi:MAG: tail fiber domain-containing protein, partial [Rhodothermales bacterium]|nr:tail fiber domain-containing protein [Rhodothermales bacterium]
FKDDQGSIRFANVNGSSAPMMQMFQSGTNNATRMLVAHSPSFSGWGIQYNDTSDTFTFIGDDIPVLSTQLSGAQRVGVGTPNPGAKLHVTSNSSLGVAQLKLTEDQFDYSRITMNNTLNTNFWDIAARTDADLANAQLNFYHSDVGDIVSVNARGRVGINDPSPAYTMEVNGNGSARIMNLYNTIPTTTATTYNYGVRSNLSQANNTGFPRLYNIYGISTDNDAYLTYGLYGYASGASNNNYGVYAYAPTASGYAGYFNGNVYTTGSYQPSDEKLKNNIQAFRGGLDKIMALSPISSEYDTQQYQALNLPEGEQYGFVAAQVKAVMPQLVRESFQPYEEAISDTEEGQGIAFEAVNYTGLIPVLVSAIQEQQEAIAALQAELAALRASSNN